MEKFVKLKTVMLIAFIFTILAIIASLGDFLLYGFYFSFGRIFNLLKEISLAVFFCVLYFKQRQSE